MTKRNITIVGIVVILIALAIIGGRALVAVPSVGVNEPVALQVSDAVVEQAKVECSVGNEAKNALDVPVDAFKMNQMVNVLEANALVPVVDLRAVDHVDGVETALVVRTVVRNVNRVEVVLV